MKIVFTQKGYWHYLILLGILLSVMLLLPNVIKQGYISVFEIISFLILAIVGVITGLFF